MTIHLIEDLNDNPFKLGLKTKIPLIKDWKDNPFYWGLDRQSHKLRMDTTIPLIEDETTIPLIEDWKRKSL